jgi:hypothetical protein
MAPLDLSYDHRVINGADAARFNGKPRRDLARFVHGTILPADGGWMSR